MGKGAQTRRADRETAREEKKTDIQDGESRKEAREDKHQTKAQDRTDWNGDDDSIGQSISAAASDVGNEIIDNPELGLL